MSWMSWSAGGSAQSTPYTVPHRHTHTQQASAGSSSSDARSKRAKEIDSPAPTHRHTAAQRSPAQARPVVAVAQRTAAGHSTAQHATRQTMKRARANYTARTRAIPHAQAHAHNAHTSCTRTRTGVRGRRRSFESREAHAQIVNFQAGKRLFNVPAFNAPITSHSKRYSVLHEQPRHPYNERLSGL